MKFNEKHLMGVMTLANSVTLLIDPNWKTWTSAGISWFTFLLVLWKKKK
jgi:hypothetical protein